MLCGAPSPSGAARGPSSVSFISRLRTRRTTVTHTVRGHRRVYFDLISIPSLILTLGRRGIEKRGMSFYFRIWAGCQSQKHDCSRPAIPVHSPLLPRACQGGNKCRFAVATLRQNGLVRPVEAMIYQRDCGSAWGANKVLHHIIPESCRSRSTYW
jgi:hypothetical protein